MVFYKKKGLPSKGDIVICRIKKILPHSAFAQILEYENIEGMIHISEVSSRWTKDISEILSVEEQVVCRVEKVDESKGFIDLSIKRVTPGENKKKKNEIKNENRIEKLIEHVCLQSKISLEDFYKKAGYKIVEDFGSLEGFYEEYLRNPKIIETEANLNKTFNEHLIAAFNSLSQKSRVSVNKRVKFTAFGPTGIDNIKTFIKDLFKNVKDKDNSFQIKYIDAPEYLVTIESSDYKSADSFFEKLVNDMKKLGLKYDIKIL